MPPPLVIPNAWQKQFLDRNGAGSTYIASNWRTAWSMIIIHNIYISDFFSISTLRVFFCGCGVSDFDASSGKYNIILLSCGHFRRIFTPVKIHRTAVISASRFESIPYIPATILYKIWHLWNTSPPWSPKMHTAWPGTGPEGKPLRYRRRRRPRCVHNTINDSGTQYKIIIGRHLEVLCYNLSNI